MGLTQNLDTGHTHTYGLGTTQVTALAGLFCLWFDAYLFLLQVAGFCFFPRPQCLFGLVWWRFGCERPISVMSRQNLSMLLQDRMPGFGSEWPEVLPWAFLSSPRLARADMAREKLCPDQPWEVCHQALLKSHHEQPAPLAATGWQSSAVHLCLAGLSLISLEDSRSSPVSSEARVQHGGSFSGTARRGAGLVMVFK